MPNHVKNVLKFKGLKQMDIDFILNTIATTHETNTNYAIDFDKIIPQPKTESECPAKYRISKESYGIEKDDRPWFNWCDWNREYWGTKWNAYDTYSEIGTSYIIFVFSTAWSTPYPIIERLQLLGFKFQLDYADEDIGSNCGTIIYNNYKEGLIHYTESDLTNPEEFADEIWNKY